MAVLRITALAVLLLVASAAANDLARGKQDCKEDDRSVLYRLFLDPLNTLCAALCRLGRCH